MSQKPILVLQLRRMGDLILTFPLLMDLQLKFPGHPVYVVAQPFFFRELMQYAPQAIFFAPESLPKLARDEYQAVINLSSQEEAALCAASARADIKLGRIQKKNGLFVQGFWQLYRESLTCNNRHNMFHWADLFRLDLAPLPLPVYERICPQMEPTGRIGLFVGASDAAKRPEPVFWAALARRLAAMKFKPLLLGGPGEGEIGEEILARGAPAANLCGKTTIARLAGLVKTCDLFITPDTGPMHLANWLGARVLNLSLGNVQALETGPYGTGQFILKANMSCAGCWHCNRNHQCHKVFNGTAIARVAADLLAGANVKIPRGLTLLQTAKAEYGLQTLVGLPKNAGTDLDHFWQAAFLSFFDKSNLPYLDISTQKLCSAWPRLAQNLMLGLGSLQKEIGRQLRCKSAKEMCWQAMPQNIRLFAGYAQMQIQNSTEKPKIIARTLEQLWMLKKLLQTHL